MRFPRKRINFATRKPLNMKNNFLKLLYIFLASLLCIDASAADERRFKLVIDAGHGGRDAGAVGAFSKEKDINLKVALAFGRLVETRCPDVKVIYTRKTDVFIPLQKRAAIANKNKANLFISIHTNAVPKGRLAYGTETYTLGMARAAANLEVAKRENSVITYEDNYKLTYEGFDPDKAESYIIFELMQDRYMKQSVDLASCIQKQYKQHGRRDKGVHQAGFLVLRQTSMPAVLTELGFISTPEEEQYLNTDKGVSELAQSLFNGFVTYRKKYDTPAALLAAAGTPPAEVKPVPGTSAAPPSPAKPAQAQPAAPANAGSSSSTPEAPQPDAKKPIFKIQLFVCNSKLKTGDARFKGLKNVEFYKEGGMFKYTYGASNNYQEIRQLQRDIANKFPQTFIVAFVNGQRTDLNKARQSAK